MKRCASSSIESAWEQANRAALVPLGAWRGQRAEVIFGKNTKRSIPQENLLPSPKLMSPPSACQAIYFETLRLTLGETNNRNLCCRRPPYHLWELRTVNRFQRFHHIIVRELARPFSGSSLGVYGNVVHRQDSLKLAFRRQDRQPSYFGLRHRSHRRANIVLCRACKDLARGYVADRNLARQAISRPQGEYCRNLRARGLII